ncbi:hypothetical protein [Desmospora activa]|uniref:Uncharacterized protein n=1 Tax=Desmospora activa DSM 45169 TaxID=1121389 RepID=A0A2T4ZD77_9BACL|nr:hypothetical protein [Desmospora activa]PTM59848.1 hypothetical protein C8J48_2483 [Desmospora activa DSM 45169]
MDTLPTWLEPQVKAHMEKAFPRYFDHIAKWMAYQFLTKNKYEVDHNLDPPWDSSGRLISTNQNLQTEDYQTLEQFLEEYNGNSLPSFVSGCGLSHQTFAADLERETSQFIGDELYNLLSQLNQQQLDEIKTFLLNNPYRSEDLDLTMPENIAYEIFITDTLECYWNIIIAMQERIALFEIALLYKRGISTATERFAKEHEEKKQRNEQLKKQHIKASQTWSKIERLYQVRFGETLPFSIEMPFYKTQFHPWLLSLQTEGMAETEIQMTAKFYCHSFSNSVRHHLSSFRFDPNHRP